MIAANEIPDDSSADRFVVSDDGLLALSVYEDTDGESLIGFHGYEWRLQASSLVEDEAQLEDAIDAYFRNVVEDRAMIAVLSEHGEIVDVWVTESPGDDQEYVRPGETLSFRTWSGRACHPNT